MKTLSNFISKKEDHVLPENRIKNFLFSSFKKIIVAVNKLKFGQRAKINLSLPRSLTEDLSLQEGGGIAPLLGIYAERVAAAKLCELLRADGYSVVRGTPAALKRAALDTRSRLTLVFTDASKGKEVFDPFPKSGKKPKKYNLTKAESLKGLGHLKAYQKMGFDIADRVFEELGLTSDGRFCDYSFDVKMTGGSDHGSTADIEIIRFSPERIRKKFFPFSLKAYLSGDSTTFLEMGKDPMGFLARGMGVDQSSMNALLKQIDKETGKSYFEKSSREKFYKEAKSVYGKHIDVLSGWVSTHRQIEEYVEKKRAELQKQGVSSGISLDAAKFYASDLEGVETDMKSWQLSLWIKFFEVGIKKNPEDFKQGVLEILDLDKSSPVLITAGLNSQLGRVVTYRRSPRKDLKELVSVSASDLDINVRSEYRPTGPALKELGFLEEMHSKIIIDFSVEGQVIYSVEGKLNRNGGCQWYAKVGDKTRVEGRPYTIDLPS